MGCPAAGELLHGSSVQNGLINQLGWSGTEKHLKLKS